MAELVVPTLVEAHRAMGPADIVVTHAMFVVQTHEPRSAPEGDVDEWL